MVWKIQMHTRTYTEMTLWLLCLNHRKWARQRPLENIVGKGENAGNQHLFFFPQCFQPHQKKKIPFIILASFIM